MQFRQCVLPVTILEVKRRYFVSKIQVLDLFAKMLKATMNVIMSVCPPIRPHGTTRITLDRFSCNLCIFRKSVENFQGSLKSDNNFG